MDTVTIAVIVGVSAAAIVILIVCICCCCCCDSPKHDVSTQVQAKKPNTLPFTNNNAVQPQAQKGWKDFQEYRDPRKHNQYDVETGLEAPVKAALIPDGWKDFQNRHIVSSLNAPRNKSEWVRNVVVKRGLGSRKKNTFVKTEADVILDDFQGKTGNCWSSRLYLTFDVEWHGSTDEYKLYQPGWKNIYVTVNGGYPIHFIFWA